MIPCGPIILKLCMLVLHSLKMRMWFGGGVGVVILPFFFIKFFHFFDLVFSRLDQYKNRYLVGATPPRLFH